MGWVNMIYRTCWREISLEIHIQLFGGGVFFFFSHFYFPNICCCYSRLRDVFTPALAGGFSQELERQQVSSSLPLRHCVSPHPDKHTDFQFSLISLSKEEKVGMTNKCVRDWSMDINNCQINQLLLKFETRTSQCTNRLLITSFILRL